MHILSLSLGQDTGGQQWRLAKAWRRFQPDDEYTSVTSSVTFYPIENRYNMGRVQREWWPPADIVHLHNDLRFLERLKYRTQLVPKPLLIHHHGTMYRTRPDYHLQALDEYKATAICSTVDLWAIAPDRTEWLPQCYEAEEMMSYRDPHPDNGILRVAHAPTQRTIKSTDALVAAVKKLRRLGLEIELDIIEGVSNIECLRRKGKADVFVDQVILGYGCNAVEAWGMGIPVIAGVDPEHAEQLIRQKVPLDTRERMLEQWGVMPFLEANETTLVSALARMSDPVIRKQYSELGTAHFNRHHAAQVVVPRLRAIYQKTIDTWQ